MGAACGADGASGQVGVDAVEIDCCCAEDVGQGGLGLASVTAAADAGGADVALAENLIRAGQAACLVFVEDAAEAIVSSYVEAGLACPDR